MYLVHPHGCGEHNDCYSFNGVETGSSPRVWGTHQKFCRGMVAARFIPTGVGNTSGFSHGGSFDTVHPHGCGEHYIAKYIAKNIGGSSPRVWGTQQSSGVPLFLRRFIPTGVGNTSVMFIVCKKEAVHPHGCGEHSSSSSMFFNPLRFIPTGVGNT